MELKIDKKFLRENLSKLLSPADIRRLQSGWEEAVRVVSDTQRQVESEVRKFVVRLETVKKRAQKQLNSVAKKAVFTAKSARRKIKRKKVRKVRRRKSN